MRVLLVEGESSRRASLEVSLRAAGFVADGVDFGEDGLSLARIDDYDAILLDLGIEDMSGFDFLRQLRAAKIRSPVLVIAGDRVIETEVKCFALGADDFLSRPYHRDILVGRLQAVIRRARGHASGVIEVGPIRLDLNTKAAFVGESSLHLTPREFQILELFTLRKNVILTKEAIFNHLYGCLDGPELKIIDVFVCKVRSKLRRLQAERHIVTAWGRGYGLVEKPPEEVRPEGRSHIPAPAYGMKAAILARITQADATFADLRALGRHWSIGSIRGALFRLQLDKRIENIGTQAHAVYRAIPTPPDPWAVPAQPFSGEMPGEGA